MEPPEIKVQENDANGADSFSRNTKNAFPAPPPCIIQEKNTSRFGGFLGCMTVIGMIVSFSALALIVLAILLIFNFKKDISASTDSVFSAEETFLSGNHSAANKIAVIDITGIILSGEGGVLGSTREWTSSGTILRLIRAAEEDRDVKAILVNLNTPGGEVTASDEIYHALATSKKPCVAMMNSIAASGGYYIACAADRIFAGETTLTGSIGVVVQSYNYSDLLNFFGVQPYFYASGQMKTMLSGALPHRKETDSIVQGLIRNSYDKFASIVADARKIPLEKIISTEIGDGRIFDGKQALKLGLIDRTGYFEDAVAAAAEIAKLPENSFRAVRFSPRESFSDLLFSFTSRYSGDPCRALRVELPGTGKDPILKKNRLYFLPEMF